MTKSTERNSFIFYRTYWEVIAEFFDDAEQDKQKARIDADRLELQWYRAVAQFALSGTVPNFKDRVLRIAWQNVYPVIYKSNQQYKNGILGGRPKEKECSQEKPNTNPNETQEKPNTNPSETQEKPNTNPSKTIISSSSNNSTIKEREPELEPYPYQEPELEPNLEREEGNSLSENQIKFAKHFPKKEIDADLKPEQNIDLLIQAINKSDFLPNRDNLKLSFFVKHYDEILDGKYDRFEKDKEKLKEYWLNQNTKDSSFKGRNYSKEELNALFDSIDEIEV